MSGPRIPIPAGSEGADGRPDVYAIYAESVGSGRATLSRLTRASRRLDPVSREVVRLRNAFLQGCNY